MLKPGYKFKLWPLPGQLLKKVRGYEGALSRRGEARRRLTLTSVCSETVSFALNLNLLNHGIDGQEQEQNADFPGAVPRELEDDTLDRTTSSNSPVNTKRFGALLTTAFAIKLLQPSIDFTRVRSII